MNKQMQRLRLVALSVAFSCGGSKLGTGSDESTEECLFEAPEPEECPYGDTGINLGENGTVKVCQLTGDLDKQYGEPTLNRTGERFGVKGTDLGASFQHQGKTWILFGDTSSTCSGDEKDEHYDWDHPDAIAWTTDTDPSDCLDLNFVTQEDSHLFKAPYVPVPEGVWEKDLHMATFEVPMEGISGGDEASDPVYIWFGSHMFSSDEYTDADKEGTLIPMDRSLLAKTTDGAETFSFVYEFSTLYFVNVSAEVVDEDLGFPEGEGPWVLMWGTGDYRDSQVYLAVVSLTDIEDRTALRYLASVDKAGVPIWSNNECDATPLFSLSGDERCVGELSVQYNDPLERWLMLYNCEEPRGINMRTATQPWGSWSDTQVIFHLGDDAGYCEFIHKDWYAADGTDKNRCDCVHDEGRDEGDGDENSAWGGAYGPYLIEGTTRAMDKGGAEIYYLMSTWNPYQVVIMRSEVTALE